MVASVSDIKNIKGLVSNLFLDGVITKFHMTNLPHGNIVETVNARLIVIVDVGNSRSIRNILNQVEIKPSAGL